MKRTVDIRIVLKISRAIGKHISLIGLSMIVSYFVSLFLKNKLIDFYTILQNEELFNVLWVLIGLFVLVIGILFLEAYGTEHRLREIEKSKVWVSVVSGIGYGLLIGTFAIYLTPLFKKDPLWITEKFHRMVINNAIGIYLILIIFSKIITTLFVIFKSSIPDSKERLTIVLTIFATIISAIALFK